MTIDGYGFQPTFFGPMIRAVCADCGHWPVGIVPERVIEARCNGCARKAFGLD